MTVQNRTVIVGASIAGISTAESLRRSGYEGQITVLGEEPHTPYNRPPLSKQVLAGEWTPAEAAITPLQALADLDISLHLGTRATGVDRSRGRVRTAEGDLPYDSLVIASGVSARRQQGLRPSAGVHCLRTLDDITGLLADIEGAARALVVGAGILGCEIAAGLAKRGKDVTLVGRGSHLRFGQVGTLLSPLLRMLHQEHDVRLRLGVQVGALTGAERAEGAVLSDGSRIASDVIVMAMGSSPRTDWLAHAGLDLADGVVCDASGRAADRIYAVGDIARWTHQSGDFSTRVEHQQTAIEQAHAVADSIVTGRHPAADITPFFWSELYGTRIQAHGRFDDADALEVLDGEVAEGRFVALATNDGAPVGLIGWNMSRAFREARMRYLTFPPTASERQLAS